MANRVLNPIAAYEAEMRMASARPVTTTQAEKTAAVRALLYGHFRKTNSFGTLHHMADVIEQITPDLKHAPGIFSPGLRAFYDFDKPLTSEEVTSVAGELRNANPSMPDLEPDLIKSVHTVLCDEISNGGSKFRRGNLLPYRGIAFFLKTCAASSLIREELHREDLTTPNMSRTDWLFIVKVALNAVEIHNRHTATSS